MDVLALTIEQFRLFFAAEAQPEAQPELVPQPHGPALPPRKPSGLTALAFLVIGLAIGYVVYQQSSKPAVEIAGGDAVAQAARFGTATTVAQRGELQATLRLSGTIIAEKFAAIRAPRQSLGRRFASGGGGSGGSGGAVFVAGGDGGGGGSSRGGGALTLVKMAAPGSRVEAGEEVASFDSQSQQQMIDDQQAQVVQAQSLVDMRRANLMMLLETTKQEMRTAKAEYGKAVLDLQTAEVLSEIQAEILKNTMQENQAAAEQLEEEVRLLEIAQRAELRAAEIDKEQEEIDLKRALLNASRTELKTPLSGIVVMQTIFRNGTFAQVAEGDEVYPGAYFMQIVDPDSMVLQASVNQADSHQVRVGQQASIRLDAYPERSWKGRVLSVAPMTESSGGGGGGRMFGRGGSSSYVRNVTVLIEILERDPVIIPDLSASADVVIDSYEDVLLAPRAAVHQGDGEWFVQLRGSKPMEFIRRAVELGPKNDTQVAIVAGLNEGDEIALTQVRSQ